MRGFFFVAKKKFVVFKMKIKDKSLESLFFPLQSLLSLEHTRYTDHDLTYLK